MDILQQAIVDAKNIREAAVASAKATLEESFRPTLQRMISSKLEEEGEEEDIDVAPEAPEEAPEEAPAPAPAPEEAPAPAPEEGEAEDDLDLEELLAELDALDTEEEVPAEDAVMESDDDDEDDAMGGSEDDDEVVDLDELLAEAQKSIKKPGTKAPASKTPDKSTSVLKENRELKKKLTEAYKAISVLKSAVNDVNLLNAKLMYATKVNTHFTLTESQKTKILQTFDRATSIRECKLVYTTLVQSLTEAAAKATKAPMRKSVVESVTRQGVTRTESQSDFAGRDRWQVLSGIKPLVD